MLDRLIALTEAPAPPAPPNGPNGPPEEDDPKVKARRERNQRKRQRKARKTRGVSAEQVAKKKAKSQEKARKTREKKRKEAMKQAAAENKKKREVRRAALKKKAQKRDPSGTRNKATPKGKPPVDMVPAQLRHCMLALKHKRGKSEKAAWNICRWSLTRYGYLKGPYRVNTKLPKATKQTSKGVRRTMQHAMEKGPLNKGISGTGATKARKFAKMFKKLEPDVVKKGR